MIYRCLESRRDDLIKVLNRLQRKAERHGMTLSWIMGESYSVEVAAYSYNYINYCTVHHDPIMIEVFNIDIDADVIAYDGHTVVAMIEHLDGGNIVHAFGVEALEKWRTIPAACDHCGGNHGQKVTYIVRDASGNDKQVGKTCLKEYTGIDPVNAVLAREVKDIFLQEDFCNREFDLHDMPRVYDTVTCIAHAIAANRAQGYIKSGCINANKDVIINDLQNNVHPSESDKEEAQKIADAVANMDATTAGKYLLDNVQTLIKNGYSKLSHMGYIAYSPVAFARYADDMRKEEESKETSEHIGSIGERVDINVKSCELLTSWSTQYGFIYLYKFADIAGNVLIWYASKAIDTACKCIKATIKDHSEHNGVKQTIITRCKAY